MIKQRRDTDQDGIPDIIDDDDDNDVIPDILDDDDDGDGVPDAADEDHESFESVSQVKSKRIHKTAEHQS